MTRLVVSSRIYQPVADVDAYIGDPVIAFGATAVALRAEANGATRKPLETTRRTLLDLATEPDARVTLFVARDPETKRVTEGMAGIQALLANKHIAFEVVSSPFPSRICSLLTELDERVARARKAVQPGRRIFLTSRVLELATTAIDERDGYLSKLEAGKAFMDGDQDIDAKWIGWLRIYEALCQSLERAKAVLA